MKPLNRILVPVDFSPGSDHAVRYAASLAPAKGGEVHMLHVLPPPEFGFAMIEPDSARLSDLLAKRREDVLLELSRVSLPANIT